MTGRSRGFGFVTMSSVSEVEAAEQQFNGYVRRSLSLSLPYLLMSMRLCECLMRSMLIRVLLDE